MTEAKKPFPAYLIIVALVVLSTTAVSAAPPVFEAPQVLRANDQNIPGDPSGYTAPNLADWDGDGDLDLMVGSFDNSPVYLFINVAEEGLPEFEAMGAMEADGEVIDGPAG